MPPQEPTGADRTPDFKVRIEATIAEVLKEANKDGLDAWALELIAKGVGIAIGIGLKLIGELALPAADALSQGKEFADPTMRRLAGVALEGLFGKQLDISQFGGPFQTGASSAGDRQIGAAILELVSGAAGLGVEATRSPSPAGAEQYLGTVTKMTMQGWLQETAFDLVSLGHWKTIGELDERVVKALGIENVTNMVLGPLLDATAVQPLEWWVSQKYRHRLLRPAEAIEAYIRGNYTYEQLYDELSRQGYSDDRIVAWIAGSMNRVSIGDLFHLFWRGAINEGGFLDRAKTIGYPPDVARQLLEIENQKRTEQWRKPIIDAAVAAFIAGEIEEAELRRLVEGNVAIYAEAQFTINAAVTRRGYRRRHLSSSDARRLAVKGILGVADYRRELEREGYTFEAVAALELELRADLADRRADDELRKEQEADRAREKQKAADDKAAREAALEARNALPTLTEYRRAYVRGLITRDTFANAIVRDKVAISTDDLVILLEDADVDRAAFLEREEAAEAARAKKPDPSLPLEKYEASVLRGVLSLEQFARELVARDYDQAEQDILVAELHDRLEQQQEAKDAKAAATERARLKAISLPDFERAVRLGARTLDDYAAQLDALDTPEVAKALMLDLLDAQLAQDAETRATREAREAAAAEKRISLAQRRRAVITGVRPRSYYEDALREANWPTEDQVVELALVDVEIAADAAARERRAQVEEEHEAARLKREADAAAKAAAAAEPPPPPTLSLVQLERAVKLGFLPPDALRDELALRGYSPDDAELLVALVIASIPETREAEERETVVAQELAAKNVSLADLQAGVLRGFLTLADYEGELRGRGYGDDDVLLLVSLLDDRVALAWSTLRKSIAARIEKTEGAPPLDEILAALEAGELDVATLIQVLVRFGVDEPTSTLFARMVEIFGGEA